MPTVPALTVREVRLIELQTNLTNIQIEQTLTKREQFAAMAMQSLLLGNLYDKSKLEKTSYEIADAMIKESKQQKGDR